MSENVLSTASPTDHAPTCQNCETAVRGAYCHECGQKTGRHRLDFHHFAHEAVHEFLHLDGKIVQTLKLLVLRPGELTRQFIAGRRARYISPIRLYLTFSVLFFALTALFPSAAGGTFKVSARTPAPGAGTSALESRLRYAVEKMGGPERVGEAVMHGLPKAMFVLMPALGGLTWLFYRRRQPYYIPHLYYAIHFNAFLFLLFSVMLLLAVTAQSGRIAGALLFWTSVPYHFAGLRRVFGGTLTETLAKGAVIGLGYWLLSLAAVVGVIAAIVLTV